MDEDAHAAEQRVLLATVAVIERLQAAVRVFEGEGYRLQAQRSFIGVFDEQKELYGEDEARRIMREAFHRLRSAMAQTVSLSNSGPSVGTESGGADHAPG